VSGQVGVIAAFGAGLVSFLSPCVLPLIPGYLSFLGGLNAGDSSGARRSLVVHSLLFVAGFTFVFVVLGASASALGALLAPYRPVLARASGVLVFAFGFLLLGVVKVPWLYGEARFDPARARSLGRFAAPVMGVAFGFGWTPCVGPILGSILALASQQGSASAVLLLFVYSLGLGVPFVLAALLLSRITPLLRFFARHSAWISRIAGVVLMLLGAAIATGTLTQVSGLLTRWLPTVAG
jgi:cytochrome c-type biogenesis protein